MLVKLARVAFLHYEQWRKDLRTHLKTHSGEKFRKHAGKGSGSVTFYSYEKSTYDVA